MRSIIDEIEDMGVRMVVIGNGSPEEAVVFKKDMGFDFRLLTDPEGRVFQALRTRRSLAAVFHPMVFLKAAKLFSQGGRQKGVQGDALQNGGVFLIMSDGAVSYEFSSNYPGHHPTHGEIIDALKSSVQN